MKLTKEEKKSIEYIRNLSKDCPAAWAGDNRFLIGIIDRLTSPEVIGVSELLAKDRKEMEKVFKDYKFSTMTQEEALAKVLENQTPEFQKEARKMLKDKFGITLP